MGRKGHATGKRAGRAGGRAPLSRNDKLGLFALASTGTWGRMIADTAVSHSGALSAPGYVRDAIELCGKWAHNPGHWFVRPIIGLKVTCHNHGLRIRGQERQKATPDSLKKWLQEVPNELGYETREEQIRRFVAGAWRQRFVYSNVTAIWWTQETAKSEDLTAPFPMLVSPEECQYLDNWGAEELTWVPANSEGAPAVWKQRPGRGKLLPEDEDFRFAVYKTAEPGGGYGWPEMSDVFGTLASCDSQEAADCTMALAARTVIRQHGLGGEIRYGPNAGRLYYDAKRGTAVQKAFTEASGLVEVAGRFDHKIGYVTVDPKAFDGRRWENIVTRLRWWAAPYADMILVRGTAPFLMPLARTAAEGERAVFGLWLERVVTECFGPPEPITLAWSSRCFHDARIASETAKHATSLGGLSIGGYNEEVGIDDPTELERKRKERGELEDRLPLYDVNHAEVLGGQAGQGETGGASGKRGKTGGRPTGKGDPNDGGASA